MTTTHEHEHGSPSVGEQVDLDAQLRWLTYLHANGATAEQVRTATDPIRRRHERAESALAARIDEHEVLAMNSVAAMHHAVAGTSRDTHQGLTVRGHTQQRLVTEAEQHAQAERDTAAGKARTAAEDAVLAEQVSERHIDTAPTEDVRAALLDLAAAQRNLTHLQTSHADTTREASASYLEYRDWPIATPTGRIHLSAETAHDRGLSEYFDQLHDQRRQIRAQVAEEADTRAEVQRWTELATASDELAPEREAAERTEQPPAVPANRQRPHRDVTDATPDRAERAATTDSPAVQPDRHASVPATRNDSAQQPATDERKTREDPVRQARIAAELMAEHRREQAQRHQTERAEQLNRWHHDDRQHDQHRAAEDAPTRVGGRAIYGWGTSR